MVPGYLIMSLELKCRYYTLQWTLKNAFRNMDVKAINYLRKN